MKTDNHKMNDSHAFIYVHWDLNGFFFVSFFNNIFFFLRSFSPSKRMFETEKNPFHRFFHSLLFGKLFFFSIQKKCFFFLFCGVCFIINSQVNCLDSRYFIEIHLHHHIWCLVLSCFFLAGSTFCSLFIFIVVVAVYLLWYIEISLKLHLLIMKNVCVCASQHNTQKILTDNGASFDAVTGVVVGSGYGW